MSTSVLESPRRYTKKPVTIEAMRWDGSIDGGRAIIDWAAGAEIRWSNETPQRLVITTLEGDMKVSPGDYVIKGVQGEFYPCKPDIFAATYDDAGDIAATGTMSADETLASVVGRSVIASAQLNG